MTLCKTALKQIVSGRARIGRVQGRVTLGCRYSDYEVSCSSSSYYFHRVVAIIVVIGFAFGAPVAIAIAMTRGADAASTAGQDRQHIVHSVSEELEISDDDARNAVNDIIGARKYSFLTAGEQCTACVVDWILHASAALTLCHCAGFRPDYLWW